MQSYNSHRTNVGLDPLTSFDQLSELTPRCRGEPVRLMTTLTIWRALLPGILADNQATIPGSLLGDMQLVMVTLLVVEDLVSNEILSVRRLPDKRGFEFLQGYDFTSWWK
jgi:hypothetical protein